MYRDARSTKHKINTNCLDRQTDRQTLVTNWS